MIEYNIRQDLPSVKVDIALIKQLEDYILNVVPSIVGIEKDLVLINYKLEIVDTLGSGIFNQISEFPLSMFQNGTEKIKFGYTMHSTNTSPYFSVQISFGKRKYNSVIDVNLKGNNPSEKANGIYNEISSRIRQHKTNNFILHNGFLAFIGGSATGAIVFVFILYYSKHFLLGSYLFAILSLIIFIAAKGAHLKPYSEFSTSKQLRNNRTFNYVVLSVIIPLVITILYDTFK